MKRSSKTALEYRDGWLYYTAHHHASRVGTHAGSKRPNGYWYIGNELLHLIVWTLHNGPVPAGYIVDHRSRNKDDCAIENLRLATYSESSANRELPSQHREYPVGVRPYRNKWRAQVNDTHLGTFNTMEEAHAARLAAVSPFHIDGGKQ